MGDQIMTGTPQGAHEAALIAKVSAALAEYVGGVPVTHYTDECVSTAISLVLAYVGKARTLVPDDVMERAIIEAGAELFHRKSAPNGVKSFGDGFDGATVRVARDPMVAARPILDPYLGMAIS